MGDISEFFLVFVFVNFVLLNLYQERGIRGVLCSLYLCFCICIRYASVVGGDILEESGLPLIF